MPTKTKEYKNIIFSPEVIRGALEVSISVLPNKNKTFNLQTLEIFLPSGEHWAHDSEDEFFSDYRKGFTSATYRKMNSEVDFIIWVSLSGSRVSVKMENRTDVEKVFNVFEANVDKCRLPEQPKEETRAATNWVVETLYKIETHCPDVSRKLRLALLKLESENVEEWQNAAIQIRDAWIEITQWLCRVKGIDTSDIAIDAVIDRFKKLDIDKSDERLFNLARASFNLSMKHHKRDIDFDTAVACVISTIVAMKTVIMEVFNAHS